MPGPFIWGPNGNALNLDNGMQFGIAGPSILSGTVDPTSVATLGVKGSVYLNTSNGNLYQKTDNGSSTNWVIVGGGIVTASGTLATMNALTGSAGQIFYNTTYHATFQWQNNRWWPFGNPDPRYGFVLYDEFVTPNGGSSLGWASNSSSAVGLSVVSDTTSQGLYYVEPSTAATRANLYLYTAGLEFGGTDFYIETKLQLAELATVSQDFCATFGFNNNLNYDANGACTNGANMQINRAVNGANWITNTVSGGTATTTNTSTAIAAATWYRLGILVSKTNSNVTFYVNGTLIATHTTNIPSGTSTPMGIQFKMDKTVGSSAVDMYLDYFSAYGFFTTARGT
jgi:hypothetical protein